MQQIGHLRQFRGQLRFNGYFSKTGVYQYWGQNWGHSYLKITSSENSMSFGQVVNLSMNRVTSTLRIDMNYYT